MSDSLERHLERLRSEPVPLPSPEEAAAQREVLVPRLLAFAERAQERRSRRRQVQRYGAVALAAVCLLGVTWALQPWEQKDSVVATAPPPAPHEPEPLRLRANDRIVTRAGQAAAELESGAFVVLAEEGTLELAPDPHGELLVLTRGRVSLEVPPLPVGRSLKVRTSQALITVHGTRFSVAVETDERGVALSTEVTVDEGRVSVDSEGQTVFLTAGSSWSSVAPSGRQATSPQAPTPAAPTASSTPPAGPSASVARRTPPTSEPRPSDLSAENRLFAAAIAAKQAGDTQKALQLIDQLLSRYPSSPLRGAAEAERETLRDLAKETRP